MGHYICSFCGPDVILGAQGPSLEVVQALIKYEVIHRQIQVDINQMSLTFLFWFYEIVSPKVHKTPRVSGNTPVLILIIYDP